MTERSSIQKPTSQRLHHWLQARVSLSRPNGLVLSAGIVVAVLALIGFVGITVEVLSQSSLVAVDQHVLNYIPSMRTHGLTILFRFFTTAASSISSLFLIIVLGILYWRRQKMPILVLILALGMTALSSTVLKLVIARARPDQLLGLVHESSFSFPSGHTLSATVLYGLLAYMLFRVTTSAIARLEIVVGALSMIILVGYSRVYLGVHFPTDVVASFLAGTFIISLFITAIEMNERYKLWPDAMLKPSLQRSIVIAFVATLIMSALFAAQITPLR